MNDKLKEKPWVEKYRPKIIADCILPERIKKKFQDFVDNGEFPNLLLTGTAGTGKTTIAKAICHELEYDVLLVNASSERNIDTVRTTIRDYACTVSLMGNKKAVILDEADGLAPAAQAALRAMMEEFHSVRFILTCNFKNKLIEPIHSRAATIEFNLKKDEKKELMMKFIVRVFDILKAEQVKYNDKVVAKVVQKHYPDNRRILNELQSYAVGGEIDSGILSDVSQATNIAELVKAMKGRDLGAIRQFINNNLDVDPAVLYRQIYDTFYDAITPEDVPIMVLAVAKYQYWSAFVADLEINTMALLTEILGDCRFKD